MQVTFEISYISTNVALVPGREHLTASIKQVMFLSKAWDSPSDYYRNVLQRDGGFHEDREYFLVWVPVSAVIRVQRMVQ